MARVGHSDQGLEKELGRDLDNYPTWKYSSRWLELVQADVSVRWCECGPVGDDRETLVVSDPYLR